MILARPPLPAEKKPPLPAIERLSSEKQLAVAGEVLRLDLTITDPARGTPHIQWVVGGPGQGYVEASNNSWYLHTTKSGQISLSVEVTASTGTFASKETKIMVLPAEKR